MWTFFAEGGIIIYTKSLGDVMAKIAVVGMGQGGMVASIALAKQGHSVSVFEREIEGKVSYDWKDDIRRDVFELTNVPMPDESVYCEKSKWLFVSPNEKYSLPVPPLPPMEEISIDRRGLSAHFAKLAKDVGCEICYGTQIDVLIVEDDRIVGINVGGEQKRFDLVIDASGMNSVLREQVPSKFLVQAKPDDDGVLWGYRAFFERVDGQNPLQEGINSTLVLKHLGSRGISWCNLNEQNEVDVLVARIGGFEENEVATALDALRALNPMLSTKLIRERYVQICLRCAMAVGVADGYVAIGDSAFMTMPLMGSGIESAMKAGDMFAKYVEKNKLDNFTAQNTWGYWVEYMRSMGKEFVFIDTLKRWALSDKLLPDTVDWVFGGGLIEKSDLALVSTDNSQDKPKMSVKSIFKKIGLLLGHFGLVCKIVDVLNKALKAKRIANKVPKKYNLKKIAKWAKKYDKSYQM